MSKRNGIFLVLIAIVSVISFNARSVCSQTSDEMKSLRDEIKALKEGQSAIQKDLQEIKNLLRTRQAQPQPPSPPEFKEAVLSIDSGHARGDKNARLVMIEFSASDAPSGYEGFRGRLLCRRSGKILGDA